MTLTYAITVCNEIEEITKLINFLLLRIAETDDILIQYDSDSVTDVVLKYVDLMQSLHPNITVTGFPLENDFAKFKNNIKKYSKGDYIFSIDADEIPHEFLIQNLQEILKSNTVDIIFVPRINTVEGITQAHIDKWAWKVNERGWINFPDPQTRIYKNTVDVQWHGKVHERITGYNTFSIFPFEEIYCLYHSKKIDRQEKQNDFYKKL